MASSGGMQEKNEKREASLTFLVREVIIPKSFAVAPDVPAQEPAAELTELVAEELLAMVRSLSNPSPTPCSV